MEISKESKSIKEKKEKNIAIKIMYTIDLNAKSLVTSDWINKNKLNNPFPSYRNNKEVNSIIKNVYDNELIRKHIGEIKDIGSLIAAYKKVIGNEKFIKLLKTIKNKHPKLWLALSKFDLLTIFILLKLILPMFIAGGINIDNLIDAINEIDLILYYENLPAFLDFLKKFKEFLYYFATPDANAIFILLKGKPWLPKPNK